MTLLRARGVMGVGVVGWLASGCSGGSLECGAGTVERDGVCVSEEEESSAAPGLVITPAASNLAAQVNCIDTAPIAITNVGTEDLLVDTITYTSTEGWLSLDVDTIPTLPLALPPGGGFDLTLQFLPSAMGGDVGQLEVRTGAPVGVAVASHTGVSTGAGSVTDSLVVQAQADVLMLVDQSGSMIDQQENVQNGIDGFVEGLTNAADWQLMLVNRVSGCGVGGVLNGANPLAAQLLADNLFIDTPVIGNEDLLQRAAVALDQTDPGECNEGLLRDNSRLWVIVVSDEPEASGVAWSVWLSAMEASDPNVVVSALVDVNGACGSGADGYIEIANETGGAVQNICNPGWTLDPLFDSLGESATAPVLLLSETPIASTLDVVVDGVPTTDFVYDPIEDTVTLGDTYPVGTTVDVTYDVQGSCP